jgi:hypothetical protein
VVRYSFIVRDSHPLSPVGDPTHPVNAFEEITQLPGCDDNRLAGRRGPYETTALQALGIERRADAVVPKNLQQLAAFAAKNEKIAAMWIALQGLLDAQSQAVHPGTHVGVAGGDPYAHA